jgi:hypothetical protein
MLKKPWIYILLITFLLLNGLHAQEKKEFLKSRIKIHWNQPKPNLINDPQKKLCLNFDGAIYDDPTNMPCYVNIADIIKSGIIPKPEIINAQYEEIPANELAILKTNENNFTENIKVNTKVLYENKKPYLSVKFIPIRKNSFTGKLERLISFDIDYNYENAQLIKVPLKSHYFAANSVLKTGDWFRFYVYQSGVHIITYSDIVALGMDPATIDPRNIRVYGNGGTMLPENNAQFMYDDLQENAIFISGESDGVFNSSDYILFYAKGPVSWIPDITNKVYVHNKNKYAVSSAYFITASLGAGKRIQTEASLTQTPDITITDFDDYAFHENDSLNFIKSGREFYGEVFDQNISYSFDFSFPNVVPGSIMKLKTSLLARSVGYYSYFNVYANSSPIFSNVQIYPCTSNFEDSYARNPPPSQGNITPSNTVIVRIDYNKNGNSAAVGWLDYIELNAHRYLSFVTGQLPFRNMNSIGKGISEFVVGSTNSSTVIWDVTDFLNPKRLEVVLNGTNSQFRVKTDSLMEFVAFDGSSFYHISPGGRVTNQNLHGLPQTDMVIVTYPDFAGQASRLAELHRNKDNLSVVITSPQEIFNEFSSGNQDVTAIKNFMKMFYDRAAGNIALQPKFLLLFGDASYDCLDRLPDNTNYVTMYESENSLDPTISFATDDYYAFLDDGDQGAFGNLMDIAVGRLAVKTLEDAQAITDKIINYAATQDLALTDVSCSGYSGTISNFADWRNVLCMVADDNDDGEHFLYDSDQIAKMIDTVYPNYNIDKIYLDAYPQISTPGGQKAQECTDAINQRVEKGALIVNYIGHGGEIGWAHEGILNVSDIDNWNNKYNTPLFVTATCEFSRCDDPARISAGEYVLINPHGGGVALFTTSRLAYSGTNTELNTAFFKNILANTGGVFNYLGDAVRKSKNSMGCPSPISNFLLLGDPAMKLAYPKLNVVTTTINSHPLNGLNDTVKALQKVTIKGYIADFAGIKQTSYNGTIVPIVFDKPIASSTLGSDGPPQQFSTQKSVVYKGKISVTNGDFSYTFVVPKDIVYKFGKGKLSYYSTNGTTDAGGYYRSFIIGGNSNNQITDNVGPDLKIYMNDNHFVSGGITSPNPILLAYLSDSAGLNTVGNGIGHDIVAVIDDNTEKTYVLNDYYESDLNTYQKGSVKFPFKNLDAGDHKLLLKAWDVYNNSAEGQIDFVVAESAQLALSHVLNYPNPFTTSTQFWFEHNQPCCGLDVQIQIFTISGRLIKTIMTHVETNGFRADPIPWDGTDDYGDHIGKGVYIYKLRVKNSSGLYADKTEKLVILK